MCTFVTAVLPESADLTAMAALFEKHKIGFRPISAPHALQEIASRDVLILTTSGACDCGTPLGSLRRYPATDTDQQIEKLRKKGWSEAKIVRWREQKGMDQEKELRVRSEKAQRAQPLLEFWIEFVADVLKSGRTSRLGLLLLWSELQYDSRRTITQEWVSLDDLSAERLLSMEEDTIYQFHR
jgi:hypothetical protein